MINQRELFLRHQAQTSPTPMGINVSKAKGCIITDVSGKKYLDLISGIAVSSIGHRHSQVLKAIRSQLNKYLHVMVYGEFIQSPQVELATILAKQLPKSLSCTYLVNSGSEAIEGAMKLAKRFTGKTKIIAFNKAYHGSTQGALSLIGDEYFKNKYRPLLPNIVHVEINNLDSLLAVDDDTAAVIVEPVQGEAGVLSLTSNFLNLLKERCREKGALLVFDEIQTGFGRTGSLFAFQKLNVIPDILCLAKGMGGGMPIGAFISSEEIMSKFTFEPILGHITTFGGHPVNAAAAVANLKVLIESKLINEVGEKELLFRKLLKHPLIKDIRTNGLLIAVEFSSFELNKKIIDNCIKQGLIVDWFLFNSQSMRITPPLIITKAQIRKACSIIQSALNQVTPD